jgi:hypothetical protein
VITGALPPGVKNPRRKSEHSPQIVPRLKIDGVLPPPSHIPFLVCGGIAIILQYPVQSYYFKYTFY